MLLATLLLTGCGSARWGATITGPGSAGLGKQATAGTAARLTGQVPKGFAAKSVTFVSTQRAFVLGTAPGRHSAVTVIARTTDRGAHWTTIPAPQYPVGSAVLPGRTVWGIRFASPSVGWVFGSELLQTTDGGARWTLIPPPGNLELLSLAVNDGQVLALFARCTDDACPAQGTGALYRQPLTRAGLQAGSWREIASVATINFAFDSDDLISTQGRVAAVLDGNKILVTGNGGLTLAKRPVPCTKAEIGGPAVAAALSDHELAVVCDGQGYTGHVDKTVQVSDDLGAHWSSDGSPPSGGGPLAIAGTPGHLVLAAESAASWLYYSPKAGHWSTAYFSGDGGQGFADLGFTTAANGIAISGPVLSAGNPDQRLGLLLLTGDGGATWHAVRW
jgi:hypothetical protein